MPKKTKKNFDRISNRENNVLSIILQFGLSMIIGASLGTIVALFPSLPVALDFLLKEINKKRESERKLYPSDLRKIFENMKRKRLVDVIEKENGEIKITLKEKGIKYAIVNNLNKLNFKKPKKWDKQWRIIIFDIPEKYKKERDALVIKIKELNFYPLQKSVFVYPYPITEIIGFLSEVLDISPYLRILEVKKIEGEEEILAHFELKT